MESSLLAKRVCCCFLPAPFVACNLSRPTPPLDALFRPNFNGSFVKALSSVSVLLSSLACRLYRPPVAARKAAKSKANANANATLKRTANNVTGEPVDSDEVKRGVLRKGTAYSYTCRKPPLHSGFGSVRAVEGAPKICACEGSRLMVSNSQTPRPLRSRESLD